ncbi:MAG: RagB/SusD family nutrient uptake outer membrane protein [Mucilaginibacter sp.]
MKRNYLKYTSVILLGLGAFLSCKKSYLETSPKGKFAEANYYSTPDQAFAGLAAAYDPMVTETGGLDNTYSDPRGALNSASDDCYTGGGGPNDVVDWQVWNDYNRLTAGQGPQQQFWAINYLGVSRANTIISVLQNQTIPGLSDATKNRYIAEALFLRAHYDFDLLRLFGNIVLINKPLAPTDIYNQPQAKPADVYAAIESDLNAAIPNLPATVSGSELGRVTQGAAIALLGKVYLYNNQFSLSATQLAKVNGPTPGGTTPVYGYKLLSNYGAIFSPDNKFNSESIFEWNFTPSQAYTWNNWDSFKGDVYTQMIGPRDYSGPVYAGGWGFNPITQGLHDALKGDPRYGYTIYNMDSLTKAQNATYTPSYQNTGFFLQKYAPLTRYRSSQGTAELNYPNNYIEIRLADTYLMEAEALVRGNGDQVRAAALLNAVRARVGLTPVAATLDNIKNERRLELATEGHRWFDLVRWGDAPTVLAFKNFKKGVNEVLPIPLADLANTKLVQNPGYGK